MRGKRLIAPALMTGALLAGCSSGSGESNSDEERRLQMPADELAAVCGATAIAPDAYVEVIGTGPVASVESNDDLAVEAYDRDAIVGEVITDLAGNDSAIALVAVLLRQQGSAYEVADVVDEHAVTLDLMSRSSEDRQAVCDEVTETLAVNGEIAVMRAGEVRRVTNSYSAGELAGLKFEEANVAAGIPVLAVRDQNGAVRYGIVLDNDRDGEVVLAFNDGDGGAQGGEDGLGAGEDGGNEDGDTSGEDGEGADGRDSDGEQADGGGQSGGETEADDEGDEGDGTGDAEGDSDSNGGGGSQGNTDTGPNSGTDTTEGDNGGGTGNPDNSGPSHGGPDTSAPGTSQPGTVDTEPGAGDPDGPGPSHGGPDTTGVSTTTGPEGTTPSTTTPESTTTTITVPEETTTTTSTTNPLTDTGGSKPDLDCDPVIQVCDE